MTGSPFSAENARRLLLEGAADGLNLLAFRTQAVSVSRTPLEYGDLRDSQVTIDATPEDLRSGVVSDSPYAVTQHERLDFYHDDGQAKFLESAVTDVTPLVGDIMATAVRRKMGA